MSSKKRSGNKSAGLTKNQRKKQAYAALSAATQKTRTKGGKASKRAARNAAANKLAKLRDHQTDSNSPACGNVGCKRCFPELNNGVASNI
jgi:hypothetical protein